jgi:single-stranded-DNA-specific exonuclease
LARDVAEPAAIPGLLAVAARVEAALAAGQTIAVYGDFDVDGMSSTTLLTQALRALAPVYAGGAAGASGAADAAGAAAAEKGGEHAAGAAEKGSELAAGPVARRVSEIVPFIPRRFDEGYGMSAAAIERLLSLCTPDLIVTVDNGISAGNEAAEVLAQGIDVCITDHHEPGENVPQGVPVADPKLDPACPCENLAGVGVALMLVRQLGADAGLPDFYRDYLDLCALGTVSDMMILDAQNRALVTEGIACMRRCRRPGLVALAGAARVDLAHIEAENLPFSLVPRLNAAGRMGDAQTAFDLLMATNDATAQALAGELEELNNERRRIEGELTAQVEAQAEERPQGERALVLAGEGWHEGVKGIVAARMVQKHHVPCVLFSVKDGLALGSGRTQGQIDLYHAVEEASDLTVRFGGHPGAVGVTLEEGNVDAFRERLLEALAAVPPEAFIERQDVTLVATPEELTLDEVQSLELLQPFGKGNKRPLVALTNVTLVNKGVVGATGEHLRCQVAGDTARVGAIFFKAPQLEELMASDAPVDVVAEVKLEEWQGRVKPKLMIKAVLPRTAARQGEGLDQALLDEFLPGGHLHPVQAQALARLDKGESLLCVMATGRGKSLIFQLHAAKLALAEGAVSVFVYPLRALVNDQVFHMQSALANLGLRSELLTGETSPEERARVYAGLAAGTVDVVATTPEYLCLHTKEFAQSERVRFVVLDEAHHAAEGLTGRACYQELPRVLAELGQPQVLATSATVGDEAAARICERAGIPAANVLVDATSRENLHVVDERLYEPERPARTRDEAAAFARAREEAKLDSVAAAIAEGGQSITYVNSRVSAVTVVRALRERLPQDAPAIAFYHAGQSRAQRARIEAAFREGRVRAIVATSAFGEGVNLPAVRHVCLYHLPFGFVDFNQMAGRAGRDGKDASIHLLFAQADVALNLSLLGRLAPPREALVALYQTLRHLGTLTPTHAITSTNEELVAWARQLQVPGAELLDEHSVASGLAIFVELGFIAMHTWGERRTLCCVDAPPRMDLENSVRYQEGRDACEQARAFATWAFAATGEELRARITHPIAPAAGASAAPAPGHVTTSQGE